MGASFASSRLLFAPFSMDDAAEVYACITPEVTRFMRWDPPPSFATFRARRLVTSEADDTSDRSFVIRRRGTLDCLGVTAIEGVAAPVPEIGLWLRADAHGRGFGSETAAALVAWAASTFGSAGFDYPVAVENVASRHIAERLGGTVVGHRTSAKYEAVVYRIPAPTPEYRPSGLHRHL